MWEFKLKLKIELNWPKSVSAVYTIYWPLRSRNNEVLQHGDSILGSVILCGTFRRISNLWDNAHTLKLKNCLLYLSSTISQVFDFIRCTVFDFIFIAWQCTQSIAYETNRVDAPKRSKFSRGNTVLNKQFVLKVFL